jgi:hypothetical protein
VEDDLDLRTRTECQRKAAWDDEVRQHAIHRSERREPRPRSAHEIGDL